MKNHVLAGVALFTALGLAMPAQAAATRANGAMPVAGAMAKSLKRSAPPVVTRSQDAGGVGEGLLVAMPIGAFVYSVIDGNNKDNNSTTPGA